MNSTPDVVALQAEIDALKQQNRILEEQYYRIREDLLGNLQAAFYRMNFPDGTYDYFSPMAQEAFGYPADSFLNTPGFIAQIVHPDYLDYFGEKWTALQQGQVDPTYEYKIIDPEGKERWVFQSNQGLYDERGTLVAIEGICMDITRHVQAEAAMRQSKAFLQSVLDNTPSIVYVKDAEGRYLLANQPAAAIFGRPRDEIVGKTDSEILPAEVAARFQAGDQDVLASGKTTENEEVLLTPEGPRTFLAQGFPIVDEEGRPYAVGGIATDITHRKNMEDEMQLFKMVFEHAPDGIAIGEVGDGKSNTGLLYANRAYSALVGYESAVGLTSQELINYEQTDMATIAQSVYQHGFWNGEVTYNRRDGSTIQAHAAVFAVHTAEGVPRKMATIARDLTEQQRAEQERDALQQQVIDAQRDALRELSTPLIPLADNLLLMPLIGSVDSGRAQQVMEALLEGIAIYQADTVILDITGVSVVDTQVANALVQTAQAVRLLGAQILLTGIGPTMAQTLVHLGADLQGMQTWASLQRAVAHVLQQG